MEILAPTSRKEFFDNFFSDSIAVAFIDFLYDRRVTIPDPVDLSNAQSAAMVIFLAIQTDNESEFSKAYEELARREIKKNAPWLLNDPLFYGLVIGSLKFSHNVDWLKKALKFRFENTKGELQEITATFLDILSENWENKSNLRPLILLAQHQLNITEKSEGLLKSVYKLTTEIQFPYRESNFLNAIYLRAFDIVIISNSPEDPAKQREIEDLLRHLWLMAKKISLVLWFFVFIIFLAAAIFLVIWAKSFAGEEIRKWIEAMSSLGIPIIAAVPCIPWFFKRKKIIEYIQNLILKRIYHIDVNILQPKY